MRVENTSILSIAVGQGLDELQGPTMLLGRIYAVHGPDRNGVELSGNSSYFGGVEGTDAPRDSK